MIMMEQEVSDINQHKIISSSSSCREEMKCEGYDSERRE
jgi:hypothetical protein